MLKVLKETEKRRKKKQYSWKKARTLKLVGEPAVPIV